MAARVAESDRKRETKGESSGLLRTLACFYPCANLCASSRRLAFRRTEVHAGLPRTRRTGQAKRTKELLNLDDRVWPDMAGWIGWINRRAGIMNVG